MTAFASFETAALQPPQDDGGPRMALGKTVILRSPQSGRLEGRTRAHAETTDVYR